MNDDQPLIKNQKLEELEQIDEYYSQQLKEVRFEKVEPNEEN